MSTAQRALKPAVAEEFETVPPTSRAGNGEIGALTGADDGVISLVRHLFLSLPRRRRILFATSGYEVDFSSTTELLASVLARLSGDSVALVDSFYDRSAVKGGRKHPRNVSDNQSWISQAALVHEGLWRISAQTFQKEFDLHSTLETLHRSFEYLIFSGATTDSTTPLFCRCSEGTVLVLEANQTRRVAALRAREMLQIWNADLLGVVLNNRTFPVPESIYRRL